MTPRTGVCRCLLLALCAGVVLLADGRPVYAGGSPENLVILVDPQSRESIFLGNYYRNARNVPDSNILYISPHNFPYSNFVSRNLSAVLGTLQNQQIADHVDYILATPGTPFYLDAPGLINAAGCTPVGRIALSSGYTLAHMASTIQSGTLSVTEPNQYYSTSDTPLAFDHDLKWLGGSPSVSGSAKQYFIGFSLGYTGANGNTVSELIAMIDRSVASDGTRPSGTFYFMKTTDALRSDPRDPHFAAAIAAIQARGGQAMQINNQWLPDGHQDCLGIMTGASDPPIDTASLTIRPGAFCDHLTSWAGMFDNPSQVKMSRWIAKGSPANGASGSMGTVEEPCVTGTPGQTWKFPHPRLHVWYYQGVSLGEALFRSVQMTPFQCLFYGDPLARPFAYLPVVSVPDAPAGPVSGTIALTPQATTANPAPGAAVAKHELYVDGRFRAMVNNGGVFSLDTTTLADGFHDLRVLSYDNTTVASVGRWLGMLRVNNLGRSIALSINPPVGNLATPFGAGIIASGGTVAQVRLISNGRVLAAANTASPSFTLIGDFFGAGIVRVVAEAEFTDGKRALSAPQTITIDYSGTPGIGVPNNPPVAYSYTKDVPVNQPILVELPASDAEFTNWAYAVLSQPAQATVETAGYPVVVVRPNANANGSDTFVFAVNDGELAASATVTLRYAFIPDTTRPTPNPMTFAFNPAPTAGTPTTAINMLASTATDSSGGIQYFFDETTGNAGGTDSAWQTSTFYNDTGLTPNTPYAYRVKARDALGNETAYSAIFPTATHIQTPTSLTAGTITSTSIQLTANGALTNLAVGSSGLFFDSTNAGGNGGIAEWVQSTTDTAVGLLPNTLYTFRVKARNQNGIETTMVQASFTTLPSTGMVRGDCDGDGMLDLPDDMPCFVAVLTGTNTDPGAIQRCDVDQNGATDGRDVRMFVQCALNGCP